MTILREKTCWHRPRPFLDLDNPEKLTSEQANNVRVAIKFLRQRFGTWAALAKAMGVKSQGLQQSVNRLGHAPNAGQAIRAARVACVPVERLLSGLYPPPNSCPTCGRESSPHR